MSFDQEQILTLRDELSFAKSAEQQLAATLQKLQAEFESATADHEYWANRVEALETLLAQDDPARAHLTKFTTFGDD